jgi:transcriptional regulator of acetoin/glycerol metabolism
MKALVEYDWPGNVRELENCIERALIICRGQKLVVDDLPARRESRATRNGILTLEEQEKEHIRKVLKITNWQVFGEKGAARMLNINPKTLYSRMKKLGILPPKPKADKTD